MKQAKRILSIKIERMIDESPDTSWLGEYSNRPKGDYSIDRAHEENCATQHTDEANAVIERIRKHIQDRYDARVEGSQEEKDLDDVADILDHASDECYECDCGRGYWDPREYRYFNTSGNYTGEPMEDIIRYTKQDYERMEALNRGVWEFIGIGAKAEVVIGSVCQTITSGGLWGIESDSEEDYLKEEEENQLAELRGILHEMGFSKRAIATAVREM
jgi:hypothetical protein